MCLISCSAIWELAYFMWHIRNLNKLNRTSPKSDLSVFMMLNEFIELAAQGIVFGFPEHKSLIKADLH